MQGRIKDDCKFRGQSYFTGNIKLSYALDSDLQKFCDFLKSCDLSKLFSSRF